MGCLKCSDSRRGSLFGRLSSKTPTPPRNGWKGVVGDSVSLTSRYFLLVEFSIRGTQTTTSQDRCGIARRLLLRLKVYGFSITFPKLLISLRGPGSLSPANVLGGKPYTKLHVFYLLAIHVEFPYRASRRIYGIVLARAWYGVGLWNYRPRIPVK